MINEKLLKSDERAVLALRSLYRAYGYMPFKMSKFEEYDLYLANKDFLVSDRVITFNDTNGKLLALKPDVTLSIIKNTACDTGTKSKVYYNENVYRVSGATGQFKEIMQTGLECIGDLDISDIYEVLLLAAKSLETISDNFVLDISHMGILSAFLAEAGAGELYNKEIIALVAEKNSHEARAVSAKYGVEEKVADKIVSLTTMYGSAEDVLEMLLPLCESAAAIEAYDQLKRLSDLLKHSGLEDKIRIDFSVTGNMNYYNGIVFRGFISGISEGVLSGGEYGRLLANMGKKCDAIGFAIYLDLLSAFDSSLDGFDFDYVILYGESTDPALIAEKKRELVALGNTVTATKVLPEKLSYREIVKL